MKRAIITGATGAIGIALIKELTDSGIEVLVFAREESERNGNIPEHPLVQTKYCALNQLESIENATGKTYDVFYHFAWEGTAGEDRNDMYMQNKNVKYALDAVGAAKRFGCRLFVGAGSQAEYGCAEEELRADTPVFPEMGYGYAKLCAGQMTREYARQMGLEHIWVRILSVYGPGDSARSMIMSVIRDLKGGQVPRLTKGEQMWDYLYSGDAAKAFRLLGDKGVDGKVYVLGSGTARPLADYIEIIHELVNPACAIAFGDIPYSKNQVMYLCADVSELQEDTGWKAVVNFENGIRLTMEE